MNLLKQFLLVIIALSASTSFAAKSKHEVPAVKNITCSGLDDSQQAVQVNVQNIQAYSFEGIDGTLVRYEGKPWTAVVSIKTERQTTIICNNAAVVGWVSKRSPLSISLAGDILVECDKYGDGSFFNDNYFLHLEKKSRGLYEGDFCGDMSVGGVKANLDCLYGLTCTAK